MFNLNDKVSHPTHGACVIADICDQAVAGKNTRTYYKLIPLSGADTMVYVPVSNAENIGVRPLISRDEASKLFSTMACSDEEWLPHGAAKQKRYKALFSENSLENLSDSLSVIGAILKRKYTKELGPADKSILLSLENKVLSELAFVLNISFSEAVARAEDQVLS